MSRLILHHRQSSLTHRYSLKVLSLSHDGFDNCLGAGGRHRIRRFQGELTLSRDLPLTASYASTYSPLCDVLGALLQTEFAVDMTCQSCVDSVRSSLKPLRGIEDVQVELENKRVVVTGTSEWQT